MFLDKYFNVKNKTAKTAITIGEIYLGYRLFKYGKQEWEYWKAQKELSKQQGNYAGNPGVYGLPGYGAITGQSTPNYAEIAKAVYDYYNPGGWTSDEAGMLENVGKVPPAQFKMLAVEYSKLGRNLINDMDEQMTGLLEGVWDEYKKQIVL